MNEWATPAALLLSAGGGAILLELAKRALDGLSGRGRRRRDEVDRAWQRADSEAVKRRLAEEYASRMMRHLISAPCVETSEIEPFPTYPKES